MRSFARIQTAWRESKCINLSGQIATENNSCGWARRRVRFHCMYLCLRSDFWIQLLLRNYSRVHSLHMQKCERVEMWICFSVAYFRLPSFIFFPATHIQGWCRENKATGHQSHWTWLVPADSSSLHNTLRYDGCSKILSLCIVPIYLYSVADWINFPPTA